LIFCIVLLVPILLISFLNFISFLPLIFGLSSCFAQKLSCTDSVKWYFPLILWNI
jgi:hypothetical protein